MTGEGTQLKQKRGQLYERRNTSGTISGDCT
jgi:hypothetical protein